MDLNHLKACMYLRKSREDRDSPPDEPIEVTLRRHEKTLIAFSKEHNLPIVDIKKEVVSGESLSKRPKMLEMLEEIEDGLYTAILVMDIDRLTRGGMLDQGVILNTLKDNNVKIITLDKIYDLNDDLDEDMVDFSAFFARKELKMIKKRLGRGRMKSVEEGSYIGGCPPYGYDYNKGTKRLEINKEESEIVKLIFDMYVNQDMGDMKIASYMREHNIKTKHDKYWDKTTVRKIIQNPIYIGKTRWKDKQYDGKHDPIIKEKLFVKAQELSDERYIPRTPSVREVRNPLAGLIKCTCGRTMGLRASKNQPDTIRCPIRCGNMGTRIQVVEERLIKVLREQLQGIYLDLQYKKPVNTKVNKYSTLIEANKKELKKTSEQREKLYDLLEQGVYDNKTFLERMNFLTEKITLINETIEKIEHEQDQSNSLITKEENAPRIKSFIDFIDDVYWDSTPGVKNSFLHEIVKSINFSKKERGIDLFEIEVILKL